MIEVNLVPDVKQELIRAQRVRTSVISLAILTSIVAVGLVVLLAVWVFAVQAVRHNLTDDDIKKKSQQLASVEDINNTLTIQNQLSKLQSMHDGKKIDSRIFDVLQAINPAAPNDVRVTSLVVDSENKVVTIQAQATAGYSALEVFKKTLAATNVSYVSDGQQQTVPLATKISDSERSYGEDSNGAKVLRFTLGFSFPEELFAATVDNVAVQGPAKSNATDSYVGVPQSLFTPKATDIKESN